MKEYSKSTMKKKKLNNNTIIAFETKKLWNCFCFDILFFRLQCFIYHLYSYEFGKIQWHKIVISLEESEPEKKL